MRVPHSICTTTHELHWSLRLSNATVLILVARLADKLTTLNNYLLALDKARRSPGVYSVSHTAVPAEVKGNEKKKVFGRFQPGSVNADPWFGCTLTGGGAHLCQFSPVEILRPRQTARGSHSSRFSGGARHH